MLGELRVVFSAFNFFFFFLFLSPCSCGALLPPISASTAPVLFEVTGTTCDAPTDDNVLLIVSAITLRVCQPLTPNIADALNSALGTDVPTDNSSQAFWLECTSNAAQIRWFETAACEPPGNPSPSPRGVATCVPQPFQSGDSSSFNNFCVGPVCFHESTVITYRGRELSFADLQAGKEEECSIPHVVEYFEGYQLNANCSSSTHKLRLTAEHLVYSNRGLLPVAQLQSGDVVYADVSETERCVVDSVSQTFGVAKYFGLNCYSSQVLASGIKTSTFGKVCLSLFFSFLFFLKDALDP